MTRTFGDTRNGTPIRAIQINTGAHISGELQVSISWWSGQFDLDSRPDDYGIRFYNDITPASALRAFRALMYLASLRLETVP